MMQYYFWLSDLQILYNLVTQLKFHYKESQKRMFSNNIIREQKCTDFLNLFFTKETNSSVPWEPRMNNAHSRHWGTETGAKVFLFQSIITPADFHCLLKHCQM